ncbi:hypothetical protein C8R47DRAFT_1255752 [Mycena vitilis]|nr:hypothetical protein C8R47DRAFT_1255752 [Mycena vitilis]
MDNNIWDSSVTQARHNMVLNSNENPSDSDVLIVQSTLEKANARLEYLDAEMTRLRERLRRLGEEHVELSIYRTKSRAIFSPLRRTPTEFLSEIFCWTLPPARTEFTPDTNPSSYAIPMVETLLARAQKLNIRFYGSEVNDPVPQVEIFQCLAAHASRWEDLILQMTSALFPLLSGLRGHIPALRRLSLQWDCPESRTEAHSIDFCDPAPSLVDVTVLNEGRFIPILLRAHQLTHYQLDAPSETHRVLLKRALNLTGAHICVALEAGTLPIYNANEIIDLPSLQSLLVSHADILQCLRFPRLEQLGIEMERGDGPPAVHHLQSALVRSSCPLRSLCFEGHPHRPTITTILQTYCGIDELAIIVASHSASKEARKLMQLLTISNAHGTMVVAPQLSRISFGFIEQPEVHRDVFLDMAKSRWETQNCALQHAALIELGTSSPRTKTSKSDKLRIAALRQQGLIFVDLRGAAASRLLEKWRCASQWR